MSFEEEYRQALEAALPGYIRERRWFGGKARQVTSVDIVEAMPLQHGGSDAYIVLAQVNYASGAPQKYVLPLAYAPGDHVQAPEGAIVTQIKKGNGQVTIYDATFDPDFTLGLLEAIRRQKRFQSQGGVIAAWQIPLFRQLDSSSESELTPSVIGAEQSNTSIKYDERFILKFFRRLEEGTSPELEFGRFFAEKGFANTPPLTGAVEYKGFDPEPLTLAMLQGFVRNHGDAWSYTLRTLIGYFASVSNEGESEEIPNAHPLELSVVATPDRIESLAGGYIASARLLARRTAEMHLALGEGASILGFEPKLYTMEYQRSIYDGMNALAEQAFGLLKDKLGDLPDETRREAEALIKRQGDIAARFEPFVQRSIPALRTRCHGDYHLGQVLYTGDDFMIIDFEGEPVRSLAERRRKHSPLKDVAGMLRSFDYAAFSGMFDHIARHQIDDGQTLDKIERWASAWQAWVSAAFLGEYLATAQGSSILPESRDNLRVVLDAHLIEKAVYELVYELNNRPGWVRIPLRGIAQLLA